MVYSNHIPIITGANDAMTLKKLVHILTEPFLDFLYPPECLGCGVTISAQDVLCPQCMADIIALPFDDETSRGNIASLSISIPASAMFVGYELEKEGILESCIHTMKYRSLWRIAFWFGRLLGERLLETGVIRDEPVIVPVPLHRVKKLERGFNQAEHIAHGIAAETESLCVPDMLLRLRYTDSQSASKLDQTERRSNVLNAFSINPIRKELLAGRSILLVDDIITTGATIGECASVLLEHGADRIILCSIARPSREE